MQINGIGTSNITNSVDKKRVNEDQAFEDTLRKAFSDGDKEKLKEACKEFEGLLLQMMFSQMKKTIPESDLLPKSTGQEIFEDMLDEEIVKKAADRGVGLGDMLYRQLSINMDNTYLVDDKPLG